MPSPTHDNTGRPPDDSPRSRTGDRLVTLGWSPYWEQLRLDLYTRMSRPPELAPHPGRVARVDRGRVHVLTDSRDTDVHLHGGHIPSGSVEPVTGDWVLLDQQGDLRAVLPRRTALTRGAGRRDTRAQVLAANVDVY